MQSTTGARPNNFRFQTSMGCRLSDTSGDVVYRLDIPAGGVAQVTTNATWDVVVNVVQAPETNCGTLVGGTSQGAVCVASFDATTNGNETGLITNSTGTTATYFIVIDGYTSSMSGSFTLSAELYLRPAGPTEVEPNDTRVLADATGQVLAPGTPINGSLGLGEADLYRINVATPGVLRLTTDGFGCLPFTSIRMSLLDSTAAVVSMVEGSTASACRLLVAQVQQGTYYVSVARTAMGSQPLPYWVNATLLTGRTAEVEPNDTTNQASLFTGPDTVVCGALGTTTDFTDVYIFTLAQPARIQAEVIESMAGVMPSCESDTLTSRLELLSGAGLTISSDTTGGRGSCSHLDESVPLMPGTYFLRMSEVFSTTRRGFPYCIAVRQR